ncbi:hypothetical protein J3A83DRAFT_1498749 [Scleroderma citrinum]
MPLIDIEGTLPSISQLHEAQSPQIIDVDSFDTEDIINIRSSPPRQRRRVAEDGRSVPVDQEVILIQDSDDEIQYVGSSRSTRPRSAHRERIFSPPPPPQVGGIPPVPPIPHRFLPSRRRPVLNFTAEPIIPNDLPFPFEADIRPPSREESVQPQRALAPAPPSHHTPSMGFGGALLAGVRHILMRWDALDAISAEEGQLDVFGEDIHDALEPGGVRLELEREFERRKQRRAAEPDYKPEYTHPSMPQPGFIYHFATSPTSVSTEPIIVLDDSPSSSSAGSSRSGESTLTCAQCHDPLILGASDVEEGRDRRRLWSLRCGHLLDGKCIMKLMQPAPPLADERLLNSSVDTKGKQKMPMALQGTLSPNQESIAEESGVDVSPMRLLRSRRGMSGSLSGSQHPSSQGDSSTQHGTRASRRVRTGRRGKGKGKEKATIPVITPEHQWTCPVNGCGRVHVSVLIDGQWIMDERRGAIAVFV